MRHPMVLPLLAIGALGALGASGRGRVTTDPRTPGVPRPAARTVSAFQLFAPSRSNLLLDGNRVVCNISGAGEQCVDASNSSVYGGGFWPRGTPDQYIFNGGLQVAAIIPFELSAFAWAGDTVGAYIFDLRGDQAAGQALAGIYDSRDPTDLEHWPSAAYVRDPALFDASLLGRKAASDQDSWARYWDGDWNLLTGRSHPMGLLVDQRTLAWNRPESGRDVLFVIMRLINVTARDRSRYSGLAAAGYTLDDIAEIARIGERFHRSADSVGANLPDTGVTWTSLYVGMGQDPDIGNSGVNYSTAVLPFATALGYQANFSEPTWAFPPEVYVPPFASAPGLVGTKFLRAANGPVTGSSAVSMFTNFTGGGAFPSPFGVGKLWRVMANRLNAQDGSCNRPAGTPLCQLVQFYADTRWSMASGPWPDVGGGQSVAFVIAYVFAAPVAAAIQTDNSLPPRTLGSAAFDLKPGFPGTGPRLASLTDTVRQIERAAGWTGFSDADADGDIEQREVQVQPYSLLGKAAAAQALADHKFVLSAPPEPPRYFLLPGDNAVTVVWERSASEVTGDPYFAVASDPLSALYDPNFRQFDVEGYRIWRGLTPTSLELVAQYDYAGTAITDRTGQIAPPNYGVNGACAPELGIVAGCPADFLHGGTVNVLLSGDVIQVPPLGRILLTSGGVATLRADTAVTGGRSGLPGLRDTDVRFIYTDNTVRNSTPYYYAVTAFDVNSINSGPSSFESEPEVKRVLPRVISSNAHAAALVTGAYGSDSIRLDTGAGFPRVDAASGTFKGIMPPANGGEFGLLESVADALPQGEYVARIDSVVAGLPMSLGTAPQMYVTFSAPGVTRRVDFPVPFQSHGDPPAPDYNLYNWYELALPLVPYDSARARVLGLPASLATSMLMPVRFRVNFAPISAGPAATMLCGRGLINALNCGATAQASRYLLHSRWFDEGAAEPPQPTVDFNPSAAHNSGYLSGVTSIWAPLPYRVPLGVGGGTRVPAAFRYYAYSLTGFYPADFVVTWGAGGAITVRDSTHHVDLPYNRGFAPGYGFINGAAIAAAGITTTTLQLAGNELGTPNPVVPSYHSLYTVQPVCDQALAASGLVPAIPCAPLSRTAVLQGLDTSYPVDGVADGTGIVLAINGEVFFMNLAALPVAGTKWHLRAIGGLGMTANCSLFLPAGTGEMLTPPASCSNYAYTRVGPVRSPLVPGLQYKIVVTRAAGVDATSGDMSRIHTVPDPLYWVWGNGDAQIRFVNLPERAVIRIYTSSGILVTTLTHNDPTGGGEEVWDVRNRGGPRVASGVYFWHVEGPDGRTRIGRFTVVQEGPP
jgi:hypothetical protein